MESTVSHNQIISFRKYRTLPEHQKELYKRALIFGTNAGLRVFFTFWGLLFDIKYVQEYFE